MAIYTTLSKKDIAKLVDEFALGDLVSFSGIRTGSVNTHYLIEKKRARSQTRARPAAPSSQTKFSLPATS
jgi:hypothetical protein